MTPTERETIDRLADEAAGRIIAAVRQDQLQADLTAANADLTRLRTALATCVAALGPFAQLADIMTIRDPKKPQSELLLSVGDGQRTRDIRALAVFNAQAALTAAKQAMEGGTS